MSTEPATPAFAGVAVAVPVRRVFTYRVTEELARRLARGSRVLVPFGRRRILGTVVEWPAPPPEPTIVVRQIDDLADDSEALPESILELTRFVANYYLCSWGEAIEAALPPSLGARRQESWIRRLPQADISVVPARATSRRKLVERLPADGATFPLAALSAADRRLVPSLARAGLIEIVRQDPEAAPRLAARAAAAAVTHPPTEGQSRVLAALDPAIQAGGFQPFLLFGATGSGKTEVYLRAAERTIDAGRGVLYLVPEIGLTPMLVSRIAERFGDRWALMHSGLGKRERHRAWWSARNGQARVVVGARSAIFAPLPDLGLIVVDEEHDSSYKQDETPRYQARDLALVRGKSAGAVVILGSATPSLESFRHAQAGRYGLLRLGGRIEARPLAAVQTVDMREEYRRSGAVSPLSVALLSALEETLSRGEQALILRNRRGWSAAVHCPRCGNREGCDECSVALTWHRAQGRLTCHWCGRSRAWPVACSVCKQTELALLGEGTEHVEALLRDALPAARIERMDRDSVRGRGAAERLLGRFGRGEIDVLVGTQMIAKGHDFPNVTLVGVLSADQSLGLPDFRAAERCFQLLTQVAGRAGRGTRPGRVLLQVFDPDHPILALAARQDFEGFYEREIVYRRTLRFPPVVTLVRLGIEDRDPFRARRWAERLGEALTAAGESRLILAGPGPAPIERLHGRHRQQILVRSAGRMRLLRAVERALVIVEAEVPRKAIVIDVDPQSLH